MFDTLLFVTDPARHWPFTVLHTPLTGHGPFAAEQLLTFAPP